MVNSKLYILKYLNRFKLKKKQTKTTATGF